MASALPRSLVAEVRYVFRQCARQHMQDVHRKFSTLHSRRFEAASTRCALPTQKTPNTDARRSSTPSTRSDHRESSDTPLPSETLPVAAQGSRDLISQSRDGRAIGSRRTIDAPMKIIPKADITPNLRLTPKERLHIEILTRRAPPQVKQVKPYKERLLIYHHGNLTNNALVFLKVLGLVCASAMTSVFVPAHFAAGTAPWICGSLLVCGFVPAILFHRLLKPLVTRVYLRLPPQARVSPESAMNYAKNLPASAEVQMDFTRITALPGTVSVDIADLQPIAAVSRWPWQVANFRWSGDKVNKGSLMRPNPTEFYLKPESGVGKAKRDVIPGIWPAVYKHLVDGPAKEPESRWKKL